MDLHAPDCAGFTALPDQLPSLLLGQYQDAVKAQSLPNLDRLISAAYRDYSLGLLLEEEIVEIERLVQARRSRSKAAPAPKPPRVHLGATPRTPESIDRRRKWAGDPRLPGEYRGRFTTSQAAAFVVILKECVEKGACRLTLGAIAGAAGTCKTVVRAAVDVGRMLGLIESKHHRRSYHRSDPNTIRIVSTKLKDWLAVGVAMARRAKGLATRTAAQATQAWMQRKADDRRAAKAIRKERLQPLRGEAKVEFLRGAAERRVSAGGGGSRFVSTTQNPSLREERPSVATQPQEENCPSGSFSSGGGLFEAAQRTAKNLGLDPSRLGIVAKENQQGPVLDGVAYRWT